MFKTRKTKKGFTLVELLIATGIFAVFLTSIVTLLVDIYRSTRRITLEYQIYQDLRIMVKQLSDLLERNTIDYEEYYRQAVGGDLYAKSTAGGSYAYGDYGKQFYDFGAGGPGVSGEGAYCQGWEDAPDKPTPENTPSCIIDRTTLDRNTGRNPALASDGDPETANAFCGSTTTEGDCGDTSGFHLQRELYLINENGTRKTILGLEPITKTVEGVNYDENALSIVWLNGLDTTGNDIPDQWLIGEEFINIGGDAGLAALAADLAASKPEEDMYRNFSPISPLRTNILDIRFYISPLEDPYKAFAETDPAVGTLVQPHITVIMTVEPSARELTRYLGPVPRQTIQTTIYSKVNQEIKTY